MSEMPTEVIDAAEVRAADRSGYLGQGGTGPTSPGRYSDLSSGTPETSSTAGPRALIRNFPPLMPGPP